MAYVGHDFIKRPGVKTVSKPKKGYDLKNARVFTKAGKVLEDLQSFTCPYCKLILRNPQQLMECGCRYCEPCLENLLMEPNPKCSEDGEPVLKEDTRFDKGCLREITSLKVECPGYERSCTWTGGFTDYEEHYEICKFVLTVCECLETVVRGELPNHYLKCPLKVDSVGSSRSSGYGSMQSVCEYPGCTFSGEKGEVNDHVFEHMHSLATMVFNLQDNLQHLLNDYANMKKTEQELENQILNYKNHITHLNKEIARIPKLEQEISDLQTELAAVGRKIEPDSAHSTRRRDPDSSSSSWGSSSSFGSRDEFRSLVPRVSQLEVEVRYLKPIAQEAKNEIGTQRAHLAGYIDTVQTMQESVTRHSVAMEEIKLRQDILDVKTVHGKFIWKIPEIARRFRDAQDKRTISLYSPPFHTSPHGYRACVRAYLNGDGSGKGTHISVFFVLMKSEHDNLLKWPFDRPVTFELVNQETRSNSITETFMPEKRSASFQQPKSEMNVASGFPRFAPHSVLQQHQFVKGDAMYILCKIDTTGLNYD